MVNNNFRTVQIRKRLHGKLKQLAAYNDMKIKILASELLARMFTEHEKEVEEIIKELRILK